MSMSQPPSGGCVLKQCLGCGGLGIDSQPPSGGCVLKLIVEPNIPPRDKPAAFRRLCVETTTSGILSRVNVTSRLQAAVC
mgnify:CR=1 FL=1